MISFVEIVLVSGDFNNPYRSSSEFPPIPDASEFRGRLKKVIDKVALDETQKGPIYGNDADIVRL